MFRESVGPDLEDILMNDQNLFEYSPAESLINFELPPAAAGNHWQFDELDFSSDAFVSSASERNHDDLNITSNFPVLFDFADFDNSVDLDEYILQALSDDHSNVLLTPNESADSGDDTSSENISRNAIDADSTYGSSTSELFTGTLGADWEINSAVTVRESNEKKLYSCGTPEYCERLGAFRCPVESCGKLYAKVSHVRAHLRRHSGEKPYVCTWTDCAWRFARSDELARHRRSHSGDKPYRCSECSKRFARSDHLTKHGRVHARRRAAAAAVASVSKRCTVTAGPRSRRLLV